MIDLFKLIAIAFFWCAIVFTPLNSALADTVKSNTASTARQAAKEAVKETGAKEQFGESENGDRLIDDAGQKANENLNRLADEANSDTELPDSKKLFLDNLSNN